ncbi:hypothetical protein [Sulfurimonas autotrophica]|uniref:50S ribosomal protein L22 n=1 Tax=Sulfurimonas autotrophica (strain ATCC BAA-671 / DSM 16294 / JCM 11897 / OK10) TaxID=563040 RepID=E0UTW7_SULAO|nr:hypothetical protein [Sulfurimonas autotrophica]ADN09411.1 conserved hypothetical protein [Sulfurimonas autotrophica DSM 16294]
MSLKDNIEMVKDELTSEEKFFEKAVVTEKFVKKYKNVMIGSVVAITLFVVGNITYNINKEHTLEAANEALLKLEANPKDEATLATLASLSPALHDVWMYSQAVVAKNVKELEKLQSSKALLIDDLSTYEAAQNLQDLNKLENYSEKQNAIYRDLAQVQAAIILMKEKKLDEAHSKLSMISTSSPLAQVSRALMHYGVK